MHSYANNILVNNSYADRFKYDYFVLKGMITDLQEIKQVRKNLGLTQGQLAKYACVSQSLIAKVESNKIDPTFTKAQKIFAALQSLSAQEEKQALSLMNTTLISLSPQDSLKQAIKKMKKHSISQLPVLEEKKAVGLISESAILDAIINNTSSETAISTVMDDAPPTIARDASVKIVSHLLKYYPLVLVAEKGKLLGLITKSDIINAV
jgi:predicted transcriptional regulator